MRKLVKLFLIAFIAINVIVFVKAAKAQNELENSLVRFHVIANSDSEEDQSVKLAVRDAVVAYLQPKLEGITDLSLAKECIRQLLDEIKNVANQVLREHGKDYLATVSLDLEAFEKRVYDTFSLPSGIYESLLVKLGDAGGKNWWCVVFPSLCLAGCQEDFRDLAASSGMDEEMTDTLVGQNGYEFRFFLMDCFGKLERCFYKKG